MQLGTLLMDASGQPWPVIKQLLAGWGGKTTSHLATTSSGKYTPPARLEDLGPAHRRYLRGRGLDPDKMKDLWRLGGLGNAGEFSWRIFIPIYHLGEPVSWTTRSIGQSGNRYRSASKSEEKINHKHLLMGLDYVRDSCIVVEGPIDVMKIGPGAVATLGVDWLNQQLALLAKVTRRAICFDKTPEAQQRAKDLARLLSNLQGETHIVELDSKDAGEATAGEIQELRKTFL